MPSFTCYIVGNDSLAIRCGEALQRAEHLIQAVVTTNPDVELWARSSKIPCFLSVHALHASTPKQVDYIFSLSNPFFLPDSILSLATKLCINCHNARLPQSPGVHSTHWAIFADEKEYGITFHVIPPGEKRVDVGDIILERPVQIDAVHDTAESLSVKCQRAALDGFTELLEKITCDELKPRLQGADVIATAPARTYKLQRRMKDHGLISWEDRAEHIERLYRSLTAQQNYLGSIKFSIQNDIFIPGLVKIEDERSHTPGEIVRITDTEIVMATQTKHIVLSNIRDADGQEISIAQLVSRYGLTAKTLLTGLLVPKQLIARPFNDLFWERILRRITATELPFYAAREASAIPEETVDGLTKTVSSTLRQSLAQKFKGYSNEHILLTAVLIYFYRIFDNESSVVNLSSFEGQKNVKGLESFCAQYTPFPIGQLKPDILFAQALTYVAEQLKDLEKHGAFERDIFLRLKIPHCPLPVAVALCENGDTTDVVKGCPKGTKILVVVSKTGQITCIAAPSLTHVSLHVVAHLMALLESIDQHPADQCIITQLNFLTPEDFILAEKIFQGTPLQRMDDFIFPDQLVAYHAGEQPTQGSLAVFTRLARGHCKKMTAVISKGDHALVYFELAKKAQYMAGYLQSHYQIKKGDRVAICLDQSLLSITTLIALMKVGAVIVPIDPAQGRDFVNHLLQDIDPALLITRTEISYRFTGQGGESAWSSCKKLSLDHKNLSKIFTSAHAKQVTVAERQPNDLLFIVYTSGTTGRPKGVCITYEQWFISMKNRMEIYGNNSVTIPLLSSIAFDVGLTAICWALMTGGSLILFKPDALQYPEEAVARLNAHDVTTLIAVPSTCKILIDTARRHEYVLPFIKTVIIGGDNYEPSFIKLLQNGNPLTGTPSIYEEFGRTECAVWEMYREFKRESLPVVWKPLPGVTLHLLDSHGQPVPLGLPGILHVQGAVVGKYWKCPELDARFVDVREVRSFNTGDSFVYTETNGLVFLGRQSDSQVKLLGRRFTLNEVEAVLAQQPSVKECVVTLQETGAQKYLIAYVVTHSQHLFDVRALTDFLKERLATYKIPKVFLQLPLLPLTFNGKIQREGLPVPKRKPRMATAEFVPPETVTQKILVGIWMDILKTDPTLGIGIDDDFAELGGDSLSLTELTGQILNHSCFEKCKSIQLAAFLRNPTIRTLAGLLDQLAASVEISSHVFVPPQLAHDLVLPKDIKPASLESPDSRKSPIIFLTGITGFVGIHVLKEFLSQPSTKVICLIRASTVESARLRLMTTLSNHYIELPDLDRVEIIVGYLDQERFGLPKEEFDALAYRITHICHVGALVNHLKAYNALRFANVKSMEWIVRLAARVNIPIVYISTLTATGTEICEETIVPAEQREKEFSHMNGYLLSKAAGEELGRQAQEQGIDFRIVRLPLILGALAEPERNHFLLLLKQCVFLKFAPQWDIPIDVMPIEICAPLIAKIILTPEAKNTVFNFYLGEQFRYRWADWINTLNEHDCSIELCPTEQWSKKLQETQQPGKGMFPLFALYSNPRATLPVMPTSIKTENLLKMLADIPIPVAKEYAEQVISHMIRGGHLSMVPTELFDVISDEEERSSGSSPRSRHSSRASEGGVAGFII